ncbi:MAG TPA: di-heme oxidoredictase family protein, partial [Candidatus Sulfotelmatobacter sp.]|nr:di-heme oxidoredictase family protein [Candidatus Sulfotelmatobacter sp.]
MQAQLVDQTLAPNNAKEGIKKSFAEEVGVGRGDVMTPHSSAFIIQRDPFRAIRRGRQLFNRKFTREQGQGPLTLDGKGDVNTILAIGAGLGDSCAICHARPRGAAGFGSDVATRPDSRDVPHLFGLGVREMLADEITCDLRTIRSNALTQATTQHKPVRKYLQSKGIGFGSLTAYPNGTVDTSGVEGVNPDLRVRPFFAQGGDISIREFLVGALAGEMGLQAVDPDLATAVAAGRVVTPAGLVLDGSLDVVLGPPTTDPTADPDHDGVANEIPTSIVDYLEFYLLNYFEPATYKQTFQTKFGRKVFESIGCACCHIPDLPLQRDRRVADVETVFDPSKNGFNGLFATANLLYTEVNDGSGFPTLKQPKLKSMLIKNIFTDFKRHNLGPNFYERNYDGSMQTTFLTRTLWGVGSTAPYGHDGRSINLTEVILRHGGEARCQAEAFDRLSDLSKAALLEFLNALVL